MLNSGVRLEVPCPRGQLLVVRVRGRAAHVVLRRPRRLEGLAPPVAADRAPRAEVPRRRQGPPLQGRRQRPANRAGHGRLQGESNSITAQGATCDLGLHFADYLPGTCCQSWRGSWEISFVPSDLGYDLSQASREKY